VYWFSLSNHYHTSELCFPRNETGSHGFVQWFLDDFVPLIGEDKFINLSVNQMILSEIKMFCRPFVNCTCSELAQQHRWTKQLPWAACFAFFLPYFKLKVINIWLPNSAIAWNETVLLHAVFCYHIKVCGLIKNIMYTYLCMNIVQSSTFSSTTSSQFLCGWCHIFIMFLWLLF
jgi:hypothetical protein